MQCSQPLYGHGYPSHFGPTYPYNYVFPPLQPPLYPEIIGEGEVASVAFPDGSVRMYFVPLSRRLPQPCSASYTPYSNPVGAFYVRGIYPMSPAIFDQQCQKLHAGLHSRPCHVISECNLNIPPPPFQLKFHNDCWTSTTDLHYFVPRLRRTEWIPLTTPNQCASVQVDIPVKESSRCHKELVCAKPCVCQSKVKESPERKAVDECHCMKHIRSANSVVYRLKQEHSKKKLKQRKAEKKKSVVCECEASTTDKAVVTVMDQGASCAPAKGSNTQTSQVFCGCSQRRGATELWIPKTAFGETAMDVKSSEKIIGIYEARSSASCCCSDAERDMK